MIIKQTNLDNTQPIASFKPVPSPLSANLSHSENQTDPARNLSEQTSLKNIKSHGFGKVRTAVREDVIEHNWRLIICTAAAKFLPKSTFLRLRRILLKVGGVSMKKGTVFVDIPAFSGNQKSISTLSFGSDCFVNVECVFDLSSEIKIADNVYLGHRVMLITSKHDFSRPEQRGGTLTGDSIIVENGVWIGAGSTILPGVTLGQGSVVAAGSVVSKNVAPNTIVGGVPAKFIRELD